MLNILVCIAPRAFKKIDTNCSDMFQTLNSLSNNIHINKYIFNDIHNIKYDIVYLVDIEINQTDYEKFIKHFNSLNVPVVLFSDEIFYTRRYLESIFFNKQYKSIVNTFDCSHITKEIIKQITIPLYTMKNYYIDITKFTSRNTEKIYDILIYGNCTASHNPCMSDYDIDLYEKRTGKIKSCYLVYPFRFRLYNLITRWKKKKLFNIKILSKHYKYKNTGQIPCKTDLSKIINQSYIAICTSSRFNIMVKKYFEIAASDAIICGNIPMNYESTFKNNIVEITPEMSDNEILNVIKKALEDKKELERKGKEFGKFVRDNYNYNKALINFNEITNKIYSDCTTS